MIDSPCSHKQAVDRIANWLRNTKRCGVVMAELRTMNTESPDVIGWLGGGTASSILVECKISRADFHADKKKSFRICEERGMGDVRYFAAPEGVLKPEDMPEGWGLLEIRQHQIRKLKEAEHKPADKKNEIVMLLSSIRRLELSTAVFVRHEEFETEEAQ